MAMNENGFIWKLTHIGSEVGYRRYRDWLEVAIMGACLSGQAIIPCDILIDKNFYQLECRQVFKIIKDNYLTTNIDMLTVYHIYMREYPKNKTLIISNMTHWTSVYSGGNHIYNWCLQLLEMDIRTKCVSVLRTYYNRACTANDLDKQTNMKQALEYLDDGKNELFESIPIIHKFLKDNYPNDINELTQILDSIPKVIDRVKERSKTKTLLNKIKLLRVSSFNSVQDENLTMLSDLMEMTFLSESNAEMLNINLKAIIANLK